MLAVNHNFFHLSFLLSFLLCFGQSIVLFTGLEYKIRHEIFVLATDQVSCRVPWQSLASGDGHPHAAKLCNAHLLHLVIC